MATFSTTADVGEVVKVDPGQVVTATLTVEDSSTFEGTINFDLGKDPLFEQGYVVLEANTTSEGSDTMTYVHDEKPGYVGVPVFVRLRAGTVATDSDPITGTLATTDPTAELTLDGASIIDQNGNTLLTASTSSVSGPSGNDVAGVKFSADVDEATFTEAECSTQEEYAELDLSAVVGTAEAVVVLNLTVSDDAGANSISFKPGGFTSEFCTVTVAVASSVEKTDQVIVATNSSGIVSYLIDTASTEFTVSGTVVAAIPRA